MPCQKPCWHWLYYYSASCLCIIIYEIHMLEFQNAIIVQCVHTVTSSTTQMHGFVFPINLFGGILYSSCLSTQSMMSLFSTFYHWHLSILSKGTVIPHPLLLPMGNMSLHCMLRFWVPWPMLASFLFANDSLLSSKSIRIILPHLWILFVAWNI